METLELLCKIFNLIWKNHTFPKIWNKAIIIPFLKPNKNPFQIDSYRPISLTSNLCKIFERIINDRLLWTLEKENRFHPSQCGFRSSRSTIHQLTYIASRIHTAFKNKNHLLAIFFDITKAFDTIWKYKVISTLHSWNIRGNILHFINNFLKNREFSVRISNTLSQNHSLHNGLPQGAVLSPTLFNVGINDLPTVIPPYILEALFADDFSIFLECQDPTLGENLFQEAATNIHRWSLRNGLNISPSKSTAMHFCRKYKCQKTLNVSLNTTPIPLTESAKYLGLIFDNKLSWSKYVNSLKQSCFTKLNFLKKLAHTYYGSDRATQLNLYRALIRSKLDYGSPIYLSASKSILDSLNTIQNSSVRLALGAFRTTPTISLLFEANEPPLNIRRQQNAAISALCILSTPNFCPKSKLTFPLNKLPADSSNLIQSIIEENVQILHHTTNFIPPWTHLSINFDFSLTKFSKPETNPRIFNAHFNELLLKYTDFQHLYTDGSKNTYSTGCALVHENNFIPCPLPPQFSVLSAELYAIKLALSYINELHLGDTVIFSDSLSALLSIQNHHTKKSHPLSKEIAQSLRTSNNTIFLCWIPSHRSIPGNENADSTAKLSLEITPIANIPIPLSDLKLTIKTSTSALFTHQWNQVPTSNKLKSNRNDLTPRNSYKFITRREDVVFTRVRLGHSLLTHSYLLDKKPPPTCELCNIQITINHIIFHCPKFHLERSTLLTSTHPKDVLSDHPENIQNLLKFLKATKLTSLLH